MAQEPFGDIPLFRELHKLLASGSGPVNMEIARQVAVATATEGRVEPPTNRAAARAFADAVRASEVVLSGYTRLPFDEPLRSDVVGVSRWIAATLLGWTWLFEHLATRLSGELAAIGGHDGEGSNPMQAAFAQVGPLLMGLQVGALVGGLGKHALGRHDLPVPRDDDGHLFFVAPNVDGVASDYGFDAERFRMWLALREVARHLVISSVPWLARYHKGLLLEVADTIEVDVSDLERRLGELGAGGLEALGQGMAPEGMLPLVPTERHRRAVARLRAFLALFEGYAAHAVGAVSSEIVGDTARIDEGMARRRASSGEAETLLADLLGISRSKTLEASGSTFCAAVVKLKGPGVLNRVWDAPDNLPSEEEIRDPFAWLERQGL